MIRFLKWWWNEYEIIEIVFILIIVGIPALGVVALIEWESHFFGTEILATIGVIIFLALFTYGLLSIFGDKLKEVKRRYGKYNGE